jgi:competence protein ComEA
MTQPVGPAQRPAQPNADARLEAKSVALLLFGLALLLTAHAVISRYRHGSVELKRAPERRYEYRIDINTANEIELLHLPGVGPALARRIIEYRQRNGPFLSPESLTRVKGIGPRIAAQIAPYLRWSETPAAPKPPDVSTE